MFKLLSLAVIACGVGLSASAQNISSPASGTSYISDGSVQSPLSRVSIWLGGGSGDVSISPYTTTTTPCYFNTCYANLPPPDYSQDWDMVKAREICGRNNSSNMIIDSYIPCQAVHEAWERSETARKNRELAKQDADDLAFLNTYMVKLKRDETGK